MLLASRRVECLAQLCHRGREVLLVLGPVRVVEAAQTGVLPVNVEAVEIVPHDEPHRALDESAPALGRHAATVAELAAHPTQLISDSTASKAKRW